MLGVPKIFLGESEGTNRATADVVMQEFCARLRMLQALIGEDIETDLFAQLVAAKFGEDMEVPHLAWRPVWEPTLDVKAKYVGELVGLKILLPSEARLELGYSQQPSQDAIEADKVLPQQSQVQVQQPKLTENLQASDDVAAVLGQKGRKWLIAEVS